MIATSYVNGVSQARSAAFDAAAKSTCPNPKASLDILWTDPYVLSGMTVETDDEGHISWHDPHVVDLIKATPHKYFLLDNTAVLDGTFFLCPSTIQEAIENQFGWYSDSVCDETGTFSGELPHPAITVNFADPRPIKQLVVVGEPTIGQYPDEFDIAIYDSGDAELFSDTYIGTSVETLIDLSSEGINAASYMTLTIKHWSQGGTMAKIVEFFGIVSDTIGADDIVTMSILEERELNTGSLPIGNLSCNEIDVELQNIKLVRSSGEEVDDPFFPDNTDSYLSSQMTPNIRITPFIGFKLPNTFEASPSDIITTTEITFVAATTDIFLFEILYGETVSESAAEIVDKVDITVSITAAAYYFNRCVLTLHKDTGESGTCKVKVTGKKLLTSIIELIKIGTFWTNDWNVDESSFSVTVTARDRLSLLKDVDFMLDEILVDKTLYEIAEAVLNHAKQNVPMTDLTWDIDDELESYVVPYCWFGKVSYTQALSRIAEACLGQVYMSKEDVLTIKPYTANQYNPAAGGADLTIDEDEYFGRKQPINSSNLKNHVTVIISPLVLEDEDSEITTTDEIVFGSGDTDIEQTIIWGDDAVSGAAANITEETGITVIITASKYYAWGCVLTLHKNSGTEGTCKVAVTGKKLVNSEPEEYVASNSNSILLYGKKEYHYKENFLIQDTTMAVAIATNLLNAYANPRKDVSVDWIGNPALELGDVIDNPGKYPTADDNYIVTKQSIKYDGTLNTITEARKAIIVA
jgi:hypothetical protein